jgi:hypothetical protein
MLNVSDQTELAVVAVQKAHASPHFSDVVSERMVSHVAETIA